MQDELLPWAANGTPLTERGFWEKFFVFGALHRINLTEVDFMSKEAVWPLAQLQPAGERLVAEITAGNYALGNSFESGHLDVFIVPKDQGHRPLPEPLRDVLMAMAQFLANLTTDLRATSDTEDPTAIIRLETL